MAGSGRGVEASAAVVTRGRTLVRAVAPPAAARAVAPRREGGGSILGRASPLVAARLVSAGLTLSIPLALARMLPLDAYGTYYQLFLIATTVAYVLPFGISQSLYYFLPRATARRPYVGGTLLYLLAAGVVGGLLVALAMPLLARSFSNPELLGFRGPLALYTLLLVAASPLELVLTSQGRIRQSAVAYLLSDVLRAVAMVVPVLLGYGVQGLMLGLLAHGLLRFGLTWPLALAGTQGALVDRAAWKEQLAYAAPFGAAMLLNMPQQNAHFFMVASSVAPAAYALYRVGCFQLPVVDLLYTPTSEVLMVRLGELEREGRAHEGVAAFREAAGKLTFAFLPFTAFLFVVAPELIAACFGPTFLPAVPLFRVAVLGILLAVLPMDGVLRARGQTRWLFVSYLVKAAVTVPLVVLGVRLFGMMGGVVSWLLAEGVGKATLLARVPRALQGPGQRLAVRDLLPWRALAQAAGASLIAGLGVVAARALVSQLWHGALPEGLLGRALPLALAGLLFGAAYAGLLYAAGIRVPWPRRAAPAAQRGQHGAAPG